MPIRKTPLVIGEIYHLVNRGVASQPIFLTKRDYDRALSTMFYYQNQLFPIRFSHLIRYPLKTKTPNPQPVEILAFCLMPNHLHLLVRQLTNNGIEKFMRIFTNSYAKYFNTKYERVGPLFQGRFKAILIETDEQLLHVSRYIHLNPHSSFIVKTKEDLLAYPYSSLQAYLNPQNFSHLNPKEVLSHFSNKLTYKNFLLDQADYQRSLDQIKHLTLD